VTGQPVNFVDRFGLAVYMDAYVEPFIKKLLEQSPTFRKYFKALHRSDTNYRIHYQEASVATQRYATSCWNAQPTMNIQQA
jgi:hypothetical protein